MAPPYMHDEYPVVYWTKAEYSKDFQNGHRKLRTTCTTELGSAGFLENKFGVVVSKDDQQKCQDSLRPLLYTLLHHNIAPTSWSKCTDQAREYILCSLRTQFPEFRMCADDWKADMFMSLNYSHWSDQPHDPAGESTVKEEEDGDSAPPANLLPANSRFQKCTQSISTPFLYQVDKRKKTEPDDSSHGDSDSGALTGPSELYNSKENNVPVKVSCFDYTAHDFS